MKFRLVAFGFAALVLVACGGAVSTPRVRVARDLGCTAEQTSVSRIDDNRWEVSGCGRTAVYWCTYPVRDCWREGNVLDATSGQPLAAGPAR